MLLVRIDPIRGRNPETEDDLQSPGRQARPWHR